MTDLSVSVVSYRTPALLRQCLSALELQRADLDIDVTVVDNASGDGSADMVASAFPWVRLIRNARNRRVWSRPQPVAAQRSPAATC